MAEQTHRYRKSQNRFLKDCCVLETSAGLPRVSFFFSFLFLLQGPFTVLIKQKRQAVCAVKQSIFLDVYEQRIETEHDHRYIREGDCSRHMS